MKEYALVLVEVTDKVKDGDELMDLAPGVELLLARPITLGAVAEVMLEAHLNG